MPKYELPMRRKLERRIVKDEATGCWIWQGQVNNYGYGVVSYNTPNKRRTATTAHRASYQTFVGRVPMGHVVCHKCDVPRCINPAHLFTGTQQQNIDDMMQKGRGNRDHDGRGKRYPEAVRLAVINDKRTMPEIRDAYGVPLPTITRWRKAYKANAA
jgi:hypothetical protein